MNGFIRVLDCRGNWIIPFDCGKNGVIPLLF